VNHELQLQFTGEACAGQAWEGVLVLCGDWWREMQLLQLCRFISGSIDAKAGVYDVGGPAQCIGRIREVQVASI
jgi:hypothetical protein